MANPETSQYFEPAMGDRGSRRGSWFSRSRHLAILGIGMASTLMLATARANALTEVRLSYSGISLGKIAVSDLVSFSESGQLSPSLAALLRLAKVEQSTALQVLNQEVSVDSGLLSDASYTFVGESFFQLIGTSVSLPDSSTQSWTYLRDALLTAAADDNTVSAIEVLQAIDTDVITVDAEKVGEVAQEIQADASILEDFLDAGFADASD
ncbi:MAG: alpha/beta hydrolase [Leptolyngbyaceae cyanobacterium]